jgi:nitrous oxide reductase accessory protein NosL
MNGSWFLLGLVACGRTEVAVDAVLAPVDIADAECAVCGMDVALQPAPRGQVLHADGTRAHLCSLGDLRAWLENPSAHGDARGVWVEVVTAEELAGLSAEPHEWKSAPEAHYVVGFSRPEVMGLPIAAFASAEAATRGATAVGGRVTHWEALRATPSHRLPEP